MKKFLILLLLALVTKVFAVTVYIPNSGYNGKTDTAYWKEFTDVRFYSFMSGVLHFTAKDGTKYISSIFIVKE